MAPNAALGRTVGGPVTGSVLRGLVLTLQLPARTLRGPTITGLGLDTLAAFALNLLSGGAIRAVYGVFGLRRSTVVASRNILRPG